MKIIADDRIPFVEEYFAPFGKLVLKPGRELTSADVRHADALIVRAVTQVDDALLAGSNVKFVGSVTAGADHLDKSWLENENIQYATADGFNAPAVADYVVSTIAALSHRQLLMGEKKKAAVIGVGNTGSLVVERLTTLGFDIVQCDPLRAEKESGFVSVSLDEIEDVDLVTLHVPLTDHGVYPTRHMINSDFLRKQKSGCVLLNASRGGVVHPKELEKSGAHLVWCFDVWPHEPNINKSLLLQTMLATPHIAGYSVQSRMRGTDMICRQLCHAFPEKKMPEMNMPLPHHEVTFAGDTHRWQDVVLGIYNPIVTTAMMRATLFPVDETAYYFDEMRHQFRHRHEFAYTTVTGVNAVGSDQAILTKLGISLK